MAAKDILWEVVLDTFVVVSIAAVSAGTAFADIVATSADDICAATEDPCLIEETVDVQGVLDFGLRALRITGNGKLVGTDIDIQAGEVVCDVGASTAAVVDLEENTSGGDLRIKAFRACSGDGTTRCLLDSTCSGQGLGECSVGSGAIDFDCKIAGKGGGGRVDMQAAGDIRSAQSINVNGTNTASPGGSVSLESHMGSVWVEGNIDANGGTNYYYYGDNSYGGSVELTAAVDVTVAGVLATTGRDLGGLVEITAGRDIFIEAHMNNSAGTGLAASGGETFIDAGRDLIITKGAGAINTKLSVNGGGRCLFGYYGNYCYWYGGYGGYIGAEVGGDVNIGKNVVVESRGGVGYATGGYVYLSADGRVVSDGELNARDSDTPNLGGGGSMNIWANQGFWLQDNGIVTVNASEYGGDVGLFAYEGDIVIDGKIDLRGMKEDPVYGYGGRSGFLVIAGYTDVTLGGTILAGGMGGSRNAPIIMDVCRLRIPKGGTINATRGSPRSENVDLEITIHESMIAEEGAKIRLDPLGASTRITYRDSNKPPVLDEADVVPAPVLAVNPSLSGCPVCGNAEIDKGESCDDGNLDDGDGCRSDCQDEGCLAATPGYPTDPLCDDNDACTLDICNSEAHACEHPSSCDEGVACTVDTCVDQQCEHVSVDALCNDFNDCTDDICNASTGCVHADLSGIGCEDGDLCTVTGQCSFGKCIASDLRVSTKNKLLARVKEGPNNDSLSFKSLLAESELTTSPTVTGLTIQVSDADSQPVFDATMPAVLFEDVRGQGLFYRFRDRDGSVPSANGVSSVKIKRVPSKGIVKAKVKMGDYEIPGAAGQTQMSASLLFGSDPATDDCISARKVQCQATATKTKCQD